MDYTLERLVKGYIKKNGYSWTVESIRKEFDKYQKGYYVSFTAKDVIENCILPYFYTLYNS